MDTIGFHEDEQKQIYSVVAAILHIGNVTFKSDTSYGKIANPDIIKIAADVRAID